jgi:hypothetical protein
MLRLMAGLAGYSRSREALQAQSSIVCVLNVGMLMQLSVRFKLLGQRPSPLRALLTALFVCICAELASALVHNAAS